MMRLKAAIAASAVTMLGVAQAAVMGVQQIEIRNAVPTYLQVSEVVAMAGGSDQALAATATATGSSQWSAGSTPDKAINGVGPDAFDDIFHAASPGPGEWLRITFNSAINLDSLTIFGRTDCCDARDVYDVFIYDAAGALIGSVLNQSAANDGHFVDVDLSGVQANVPIPGAAVLFAAGLGFLRRRG